MCNQALSPRLSELIAQVDTCKGIQHYAPSVTSAQVEEIIKTGHIHLHPAYPSHPVANLVGNVIVSRTEIHKVQITVDEDRHYHHCYCTTCKGWCNASVAAFLVELAKARPKSPVR